MPKESEKKTYKGSCHCQAMQFEIESDFSELTTCDCSICWKKNALMVKVHETEMRILCGEESLTTYQFYSHTAKHYFCKVCGIHTHNRPRSNPKIYGINIACVEGVNPFELDNVSLNDGYNHPLDQKK